MASFELARIPFITRGMSQMRELCIEAVSGFGGDGTHYNTVAFYYDPKEDEPDCQKVFWFLNSKTAKEMSEALNFGYGETQMEIDDKLVNVKVFTSANDGGVYTVIEPDPEVVGANRGLVFLRAVSKTISDFIIIGNEMSMGRTDKTVESE